MLEIASELFYAEGINAVGVDRIAAEADASKATSTPTTATWTVSSPPTSTAAPPSPRKQLTKHLESDADASQKLLRIFDALADWYDEGDFRGCHFIIAGRELTAPHHPAAEVGRRHRAWVKDLFEQLATDLGAADPSLLAAQLLMLYDGATVAADLDSYPDAARAARAAAEHLIDSAR